jgi:hypothetical protein
MQNITISGQQVYEQQVYEQQVYEQQVYEQQVYEPYYNYNEIYFHNMMTFLLIALVIIHLIF